jgi:hypothetical protein
MEELQFCSKSCTEYDFRNYNLRLPLLRLWIFSDYIHPILSANGTIVLQIDWHSHKEVDSVLKGGNISIIDNTVSIYTFPVRLNT